MRPPHLPRLVDVNGLGESPNSILPLTSHQHVYGKTHSQFAENPENFRHLDQLISELPSVAAVLASTRAKKAAAATSSDAKPFSSPDINVGNLFNSPADWPKKAQDDTLPPKDDQYVLYYPYV